MKPASTRNYRGHVYRVVAALGGEPARVERALEGTEDWAPVSLWTLRRFPVESSLWRWLRKHGFERPPSADSARSNVVLSVRVSPEALDAVDALTRRWGCARGEAVERALTEAADTA